MFKRLQLSKWRVHVELEWAVAQAEISILSDINQSLCISLRFIYLKRKQHYWDFYL